MTKPVMRACIAAGAVKRGAKFIMQHACHWLRSDGELNEPSASLFSGEFSGAWGCGR
jgi:hypothetical protein